MDNRGGALGFDLLLNDKDFQRQLSLNEKRVMGFSNKIVSESQRMDQAFSRLGGMAAAAFAGMGLAQLPGQIVKVRGEFQQLEIAFSTMLQSKEKADKLMAQVAEFAALTPYGLSDTAEATKMLLAYGAEADTVIGTMRRLGDIASGIGAPLKDIAYLYGTTMTQGRLYTQDLNQFLGRGIPMLRELAKIFGVAESEVKGLVEAGKVGFPEVQKVIENLTNSGSMFGGLMEAQSKSLVGLQAQLGDAIDAMFNDIGKSQEGALNAVFQGAIATVENYEKVIDVLKVVVATYGTYRAALMLTAATEKLSGTARLIFFHAQLAKATGVSTVAAYAHATALGVQAKAQAALNTVMAVNPFVAGATAAVALASAIWYLSDSTTAQEKAQQALNESTKEAEARKEELSAKTSKLASVIRDETQTRYAQTKAFNELKKLYPEILAQMQMYEFKALSAADAQKMFNAALDEMGKAGLKSNFDAAVKKVSELEQRLKNLNDSNSGTGGLTIAVEKTRKELEAARIESAKLGEQIKEEERLGWLANATNEEKLKYYNDQVDAKKKERAELEKIAQGADVIKKIFAEMSLLGINKEIGVLLGNVNSLNSQLGGKPLIDGGNKAYWEKIKKDAEESRDSLGIGQKGSAEWKRLSAEIENADKKLQAYSSTVKRSKKADEVFLPTSLKGLEQAIQKAREKMEKLPGTDQTGMQKQQDIIIQAEQRIAEIRKSIAVKSFEEEIAEKQRQYELYERWVQHMGEDAAKAQFSGLLSNGASFSDYLQSQIDQLSNKGAKTNFTEDEAKQLDALKTLFNDFTGATSPMEKFQKTLDDTRESAGSLTEEIIKLKEIQDSLNPADNSSSGYEKRSLVQQRLNEAEKERKYMLEDFLRNVAGSEERRLSIEKKYADLRADLDARTADKKAAGYLKALKRIDDAEKEELDDDKAEAAQKSKEYKAFVKIVEKQQEDLRKIDIENARKDFERFTENLDKESDEYKKHYQELLNLEKAYQQKRRELMNTIGDLAGQLGSVLSEMGGGFAEAGNALSGIASQMGNLSTVLNSIGKDGKMSMQGWAAAIQGVISMISSLVAASKNRKEAEKQYYNDLIRFESEYQLALNNKIGDNHSNNPFISDYNGKVKAGVDQYRDALDKYQDSIAKLEEGRAKVGQKNAVDGKTVGQMAGSGAVAGAAIGAIVGVGVFSVVTGAIGAAIGGAVGAIAGLFAKKKKDVFGNLLDLYPELVDGAGNLNKELAQTLIATNQVDDATKILLQDTIAWTDQIEEASNQMIMTIADLTGQIANDLTDAMVNAFKAGEDGALAMSKVLGGIVENLVKQMVLVEIFRPIMDEFMQGVKDSYGVGGDGSLIDNFAKLNEQLPEANALGEQIMKGFQEYGRAHGMPMFEQDNSASSQTGLQGGIKGMSEETASVLVGQFNAVRIHQADMANNTRISVGHLQTIANNTAFNRYLVRLENIENHLSDMKKNSLRSGGL